MPLETIHAPLPNQQVAPGLIAFAINYIKIHWVVILYYFFVYLLVRSFVRSVWVNVGSTCCGSLRDEVDTSWGFVTLV